MSRAKPSLYPEPTHSSSYASPSPSPSPLSPPSPSDVIQTSTSYTPAPQQHTSGTLPPDYELLLQIDARVTEVTASEPSESSSTTTRLRTPKIGTLRIIQGPLNLTSYHAFISIDDINIPLLSTYGASSPSTNAFYISIPSHTFLIEPNTKTEPLLIEALQELLKWFCQWQTVTDSNEPPITTPPQGLNLSSSSKLEDAGDKGAQFVEKIGSTLNKNINKHLDNKKNKINEEDSKQVKLGGKVTSALLSTTRIIVGAGASMASKITDKISNSVGGAVSNNSVSRSLANAPEETMKRKFHDGLLNGLLVFGKIYVEADRQGKIIIEDAGVRMSDIADLKYGTEAAGAARNISGIAIDGYRISRFPAKLGATSIVKGALKSHANRYDPRNISPDDQQSGDGGVNRHPYTYGNNNVIVPSNI